MSRPTCANCPATLGRANKSGRCRSCLAKHLNGDPAIAARRKAAIQKRFARPEVMAAHIARLVERNANRPPEEVEQLREHGRRRMAAIRSDPVIMAKCDAARAAPDVRQKQGQALSDRMLPWCPREWRPLYRELRKVGTPVPDARRAVEAEIATVAARARRARAVPLTHEQQLERVRNGAQLVAKPDLRRAGPAYTLGGVAPEAM